MKNLSFLLMIILLMPVVMADLNYYNNETLGYGLDESQGSSTNVLPDLIEGLQEYNAESNVQLTTKEQLFEIKKNFLLDQADDGWNIILALFKLLTDLIILIFYVIEMRLLLYLFVELIPTFFIKLRDSLTNMYLQRRKK